LCGQNSTRASAKETLIIDSNDVLSEVLGVDFNITNKDTKVSYNKVLAKADIEMRILYLTEERENKDIGRNDSGNRIYRHYGRFRG